MKKTIKLTESDLHKIVKRVINEQDSELDLQTRYEDINGKFSNALYELEQVMKEYYDLANEMFNEIENSEYDEQDAPGFSDLEEMAEVCTHYSDKINDFLSDVH